MFFKTAIGVGPFPPILYFSDQVRAEAVLGRFVRALRPVLGTCFILGALWGLMKVVAGCFPNCNKARSLFSAKCMQMGRGRYECYWFPTLPHEFLWQALLACICCKHQGSFCL